MRYRRGLAGASLLAIRRTPLIAGKDSASPGSYGVTTLTLPPATSRSP